MVVSVVLTKALELSKVLDEGNMEKEYQLLIYILQALKQYKSWLKISKLN